MADQEHHANQVKDPHKHRRHIQELPTTTFELYSIAYQNWPRNVVRYQQPPLMFFQGIRKRRCVVYTANKRVPHKTLKTENEKKI